MAGDPSLARTKELIKLLSDCGADVIELGVPFTDPVADGPVIQRAAERALENGVTLKDVVALVGEVGKTISVPIILMTYYNPVLAYGEEAFMRDAREAGVDGLIIPDLPPDEAAGLIKIARKYKVDTIFMLAPTSTKERIIKVAKHSRGFIYYVSITGITGAELRLDEEALRASMETLRGITKTPVAVGFGVGSPEEAREAGRLADGVIVGSAVVKRALGPEDGLREFLRGVRDAI